MIRSRLATAVGLLREAVAGVHENGSGLTAVDIRDILLATREVAQLNEQIRVGVVAAGQRDGVFAAAGHKKPDSPVANVLGVDRGVAREIVRGSCPPRYGPGSKHNSPRSPTRTPRPGWPATDAS